MSKEQVDEAGANLVEPGCDLLDDRDGGFDESIACDLNDSVVRANAIQLLEALKSGNRMHILEAAMNMAPADATHLRHLICKHRAQSTPIDETIVEAAEFAAAIIEKNAIAHA